MPEKRFGSLLPDDNSLYANAADLFVQNLPAKSDKENNQLLSHEAVPEYGEATVYVHRNLLGKKCKGNGKVIPDPSYSDMWENVTCGKCNTPLTRINNGVYG